MRKLVLGSLVAAILTMTSGAVIAGPWEDGMAAYNRGDYVPAVQVFRGMAKAGNAKAQMMLGSMYQRGQGVAKSSAHAFMWLTFASSRGDTQAKAELKIVEASMTPSDMSQARTMMQACEASDYRNCEY